MREACLNSVDIQLRAMYLGSGMGEFKKQEQANEG